MCATDYQSRKDEASVDPCLEIIIAEASRAHIFFLSGILINDDNDDSADDDECSIIITMAIMVVISYILVNFLLVSVF